MKIKKISLIFSLLSVILLLVLFFLYIDIDLNGEKNNSYDLADISKKWKVFSGGRFGKIIYSVPPAMYILYLNSGKLKIIPGIETEGGPGRFNRGKTPRPFWNRDGKYFVYRFKGNIFISDEKGTRKKIFNPKMDTSRETRWSFTVYRGKEWIFGPSISKKGILIDPSNPNNSIDIFNHESINKHCELTGDGKYIVYDNGKDIILNKILSSGNGIKISKAQSCRPCASPSKYVAWLPAPHLKYSLHFASNGKLFKELPAPLNEEIYRLNWSNVENFAVHMFGSRGNNKMTVRNIFNNDSVFIGYGWDPDLWVTK